jgi:hypothetical protein
MLRQYLYRCCQQNYLPENSKRSFVELALDVIDSSKGLLEKPSQHGDMFQLLQPALAYLFSKKNSYYYKTVDAVLAKLLELQLGRVEPSKIEVDTERWNRGVVVYQQQKAASGAVPKNVVTEQTARE